MQCTGRAVYKSSFGFNGSAGVLGSVSFSGTALWLVQPASVSQLREGREGSPGINAGIQGALGAQDPCTVKGYFSQQLRLYPGHKVKQPELKPCWKGKKKNQR